MKFSCFCGGGDKQVGQEEMESGEYEATQAEDTNQQAAVINSFLTS